jgi:hypothetical protein
MMFTRGQTNCDKYQRKDRADKILQTFTDRDTMLGSITLDDNALIVPAGMYGQVVYYHTKHAGSVAGFLDNDPSKQGRRLYGTNCQIYSFDKLSSMPNAKIYMNAGLYSTELTTQILSLQPTATIIKF